MSDYRKQTNRMDADARAKGLSSDAEILRCSNANGAYRLYKCGSVVMEMTTRHGGVDPVKTDDFGKWR